MTKRRQHFEFTVVELTTLAASFVVTSVFVFLLGFYVGREVAAEHAPIGEQVARVPIGEPPAPAEGPDGSAKTSLWERRGDAPEASPPPARSDPAEDRPAPPTVGAAAYTVQVLATRNRADAQALAERLKRQGFGAYVAAVEDAGGTWYRVRIGHYDNSEAARRMAERCQRELGLAQAYVSPVYANAR